MTLTPGATLGPYAIRAELGHGGMGVVYTARDPRLDRQVAIKRLPPDLTRDQTAKQRFLQESKTRSALGTAGTCADWHPAGRVNGEVRTGVYGRGELGVLEADAPTESRHAVGEPGCS